MGWTKAPEAERRRQIVAAALQVAARDGLARLTLRAVAAEAGLSHALVLYHFGSKEALVEALFEQTLDWLARPGSSDRQASLDELVASEAAAVDPAHSRVLLEFWTAARPGDPRARRIAQALEAYERVLATRVAADVGDPTEIAERAVTVVLGRALRDVLAPGLRTTSTRGRTSPPSPPSPTTRAPRRP